jgi:hypothetical protein
MRKEYDSGAEARRNFEATMDSYKIDYIELIDEHSCQEFPSTLPNDLRLEVPLSRLTRPSPKPRL